MVKNRSEKNAVIRETERIEKNSKQVKEKTIRGAPMSLKDAKAPFVLFLRTVVIGSKLDPQAAQMAQQFRILVPAENQGSIP